jgi:hypothetical protein
MLPRYMAHRAKMSADLSPPGAGTINADTLKNLENFRQQQLAASQAYGSGLESGAGGVGGALAGGYLGHYGFRRGAIGRLLGALLGGLGGSLGGRAFGRYYTPATPDYLQNPVTSANAKDMLARFLAHRAKTGADLDPLHGYTAQGLGSDALNANTLRGLEEFRQQQLANAQAYNTGSVAGGARLGGAAGAGALGYLNLRHGSENWKARLIQTLLGTLVGGLGGGLARWTGWATVIDPRWQIFAVRGE